MHAIELLSVVREEGRVGERMISETLEPFFNVGRAVFLWGVIAFLWVLAYVLFKEDYTGFGNEYNKPDLKEYALVGLVIVMLCALTFILLMWTLSIMGV